MCYDVKFVLWDRTATARQAPWDAANSLALIEHEDATRQQVAAAVADVLSKVQWEPGGWCISSSCSYPLFEFIIHDLEGPSIPIILQQWEEDNGQHMIRSLNSLGQFLLPLSEKLLQELVRWLMVAPLASRPDALHIPQIVRGLVHLNQFAHICSVDSGQGWIDVGQLAALEQPKPHQTSQPCWLEVAGYTPWFEV